MADFPDPASHLRVVPLHDRSGILERVESRPESIRPRFAPTHAFGLLFTGPGRIDPAFIDPMDLQGRPIFVPT